MASADVTGAWLAWECVVFGVFVCVSTCAPLWGRGESGGAGGAKRGYVFAASSVSTLAMMLSVSRGTLGVRSLLGFPSELVYFGAEMWETLYGMMLAFPLVCFLFVPVYFPLGIVSVYQYLELRFHSASVRRLAAATFVWRQLLNLAVTVYTPSVALHAVLGLPHWATAAAITAIGLVLTVMGGLSAAIKADVIQTVTTVAVSVVLLVHGTLKAGGAGAVLQDNIEGGRLHFFNFTWDVRTRVDTLSALVGQLFMSLSVYGCQQTFVQRYCSMSSEARVRRTLLLTVPAVGALFSLSWLVGMALYAVYRHCDPLASGQIGARDEILPHYVLEHSAWLPGLLGLFLGALFNGALSFLVSNVNSLATVTWEDFVSATPPFRGLSDRRQLTVIKTIAVLYGAVVVLLSLGVGAVGGVVEGSLLVTSATSGPLLGVFLLAALLPSANGKGAFTGMLTSHAVTVWMAVGHLMYGMTDRTALPLSTDGCENGTVTPRAELRPLPPQTQVWVVYGASYMWYAVVGTAVCVVVGLAVSALTESRPYDARLLHPLALRLSLSLPGPVRRYTDPTPDPAPDPAPDP